MKKIIEKEEKDVIELSQITNDSIVGIRWKNGEKSFISELFNDVFIGISVGELSLTSKWGENSKQAYVRRTISLGRACFIFETVKELREWLRE